MSDEEDIELKKKKSEAAPAPRRRAKKIVFPRRAPSVVIPERVLVYPSPDKITCATCPCFPKEEPYKDKAHKKLRQCQQSPPTLYELAGRVVDALSFPPAFHWSEEEVANWSEEIGLPQYRDSFLDNHIDGMRLLMLEDASNLPELYIHDFKHIQIITSQLRKVYGMDFIRFSRSIGLPPRRPLPHCTLFKSRTGPSWGIRKNWTRGDILRCMKIIMPYPVYRDHWDLVWYLKPDFPSVKFARVPKPESQVHIPHFTGRPEPCTEYQTPRKFQFQSDISDDAQLIWMEHRPGSAGLAATQDMKQKIKKKYKFLISKDSRLLPKKVHPEELKGKEFILARRLMPKKKFLP